MINQLLQKKRNIKEKFWKINYGTKSSLKIVLFNSFFFPSASYFLLLTSFVSVKYNNKNVLKVRHWNVQEENMLQK